MMQVGHLLSITILSIICLACNYYIAQRLIKPRYSKRCVYTYLSIHTTILLICVILGITIALGGIQVHMDTFTWMLYIFLVVYIPKICYVVISAFDYIIKPHGALGSYMGMITAGIVFILLIYGAFNRHNIDVKEVTLSSNRIPSSFNGYKIVQISDFHLETVQSSKFVDEIVATINNLHPDVILFTGDLVNRMASEILPYQENLSQLQAVDGVFSVMGNHDYGDYVKWENRTKRNNNIKQLHSLQSQMGWKILNNASQYIYRQNDSIAIIGVENWGEPPFPQYGRLDKAYPQLNDDVYKILLSHNPRHWRAEVIPNSNIDLTLSGHTHAWQIALSNISPSKWLYPEWGGLYTQGKQHLYVNIGLGCVMMPARIGATPEITLITLTTPSHE